MRKLALLTTTVIAIMAMTAVSASAATQVRNSSGTLCSQVSPAINAGNAGLMSTTRNYASGGCTVQMSGTTRIHRSEFDYAECQVSFTAHIGGDGWGYAENYNYFQCGGATVTSCAGDRLIAPRSYTGPGFPVFTYTDAATDLNTEQCAVAFGTSKWAHSSMDITTLVPSGAWIWTNQYNTADPYTTSSLHTHRNSRFSSPTALTITH